MPRPLGPPLLPVQYGGENAGFCFTFDEPLSHLIYAACDIILVPSMFEPCGLTQVRQPSRHNTQLAGSPIAAPGDWWARGWCLQPDASQRRSRLCCAQQWCASL